MIRTEMTLLRVSVMQANVAFSYSIKAPENPESKVNFI